VTASARELVVITPPMDDGRTVAGAAVEDRSLFACPEGIRCDDARRLWIRTGIGESARKRGDFARFGNDRLLAADPRRGELRRFITRTRGRWGSTSGIRARP